MRGSVHTYSSPLAIAHNDKYDDAARSDVANLIGDNIRDILEVGCHTGATGVLIKNQHPGVRYVGIELNSGAAAKARERLDTTFVADIEKVDLAHLGFHPNSFDRIIFADVLEHLYDPWKVLASVRDFLRHDGAIIASIPNVQNVTLIQHLVMGNWTYAESGLLDATHIRFFTLEEITVLFSRTGYKIADCVAMCLPPFPEGVTWPRDLEFGTMVVKNVSREQAQRLFAFQYLVVARKNEQWMPGAMS